MFTHFNPHRGIILSIRFKEATIITINSASQHGTLQWFVNHSFMQRRTLLEGIYILDEFTLLFNRHATMSDRLMLFGRLEARAHIRGAESTG